jgi:hypothetical protein
LRRLASIRLTTSYRSRAMPSSGRESAVIMKGVLWVVRDRVEAEVSHRLRLIQSQARDPENSACLFPQTACGRSKRK